MTATATAPETVPNRIPTRPASRRVRLEVVVYVALFAVILFLIVLPGWYVLSSAFTTSDGQFTISGFFETWARPAVVHSVLNTVIVVVVNTALSVVIGVGMAWVVKRTDIPWAGFLNRIPLIPMLFPPILGSLGWAFLLGPQGGLLNQYVLGPLGIPADIFTLGGTIWVMTLYHVPWIHTMVAAGYDSYDSALTDASRIAGGSAWKTFWKVELPMLRPHILGATLLVIVLSLASYTIPVMLSSLNGEDVIAVLIARFGTSYLYPSYAAGAVSLVILAIALVGTLLQRTATARAQRFVTIVGKGGGGSPVRLKGWRMPTFIVVVLYFALAIILPMVALAIVSFLPSWGAALTPSNFTLDNYRSLFESAQALWQGFGTSLLLAAVSATAIMILATLMAVIGSRARLRGGAALEYLAMISIGLPSIVFGYGALQAYINPPFVLYGTIWALVLAYIGGFFGFGYRSVDAAVKQLDPSLEEAGRIAGSNLFGVIRRITMPLIRPGFAAGWLLVFIICFREHPMSTMLTGPGVTVVSVSMFDFYEQGKFTQVAAFSMFVFITVMVISYFATWTPKRRRR